MRPKQRCLCPTVRFGEALGPLPVGEELPYEPAAVLTTAAAPLGAMLRGVKAGQFDGAPAA